MVELFCVSPSKGKILFAYLIAELQAQPIAALLDKNLFIKQTGFLEPFKWNKKPRIFSSSDKNFTKI